ncbi:MAG: LysR family transcriptional regulator [Bacteroidota bacterium]|nr:LysR family transcriptional regulator [Kiloniellaceae bacterium]
MRPTLRQLQYLVAVAETGNFGEAAKRVNVSQPTLSAQIADMEAELSTVLVERGRHGALLTRKGEEAAHRARLILRDMDDLKAAVLSASDHLAGRLRLGVLPTIGPYLLPPAARRLHVAYPRLRFSVREERGTDLEAHLQEGQFDTVISTADDHRHCRSSLLFEDHLWICMAPDDRLARRSGPLELKDLKGRELLSLGYWHWQSLDLKVQALAEASGAHVSTEYEGTTLDAIRQMAETGAGLAILPSLYAVTEVRRDPQMIIRRINDPLATRQISLIWRDTSPLDRSLNTLAEILREVAGELLSGS